MSGGLVCLAASVALAQEAPSRVTLRWSAPDECPDVLQLARASEALLGQQLSTAGEQALGVHVAVQGSAAVGYAAKLLFTSQQGTEERFLEHPRCEKLVEAVALVIALTVDPERVHATQLAAEKGATATATPSRTAAQAEPERPLPVLPRNPEPAQSPQPGLTLRGLRVGLHATLGAGALPGLGGGAEATLGLHREQLRVELVGRYWVPRSAVVNSAPSSSLEVGLSTLGARGCWVSTVDHWALAACAGGDVGDQSAEGRAVDNARTRHALFAQAAGGLQLAYTRWRLAPEGGFEISGALARPAFGVVQDGSPVQVFRPAAWAFQAFFGLAFEL